MQQTIDAIRTFNRFYTRHIGATETDFLHSQMSLPEARLLYEIASHQPVIASALGAILNMDAGQLSRLVARFETGGWIVRKPLESDARARAIALTEDGQAAYEDLDRRQADAVQQGLDGLGIGDRRALSQALTTVRLILGDGDNTRLAIRTFRPGDLPWIAARQSVLYKDEHNWSGAFEILECETVLAFLKNYRPGREQCWIAELDDVPVGGLFLTDEGDDIARLRLLHVEPFARKRGIGDALVERCIQFAGDCGYHELILWTQAVLEPARRIYQRRGFIRFEQATHHHFGEPIKGEMWRLDLRGAP
jgi:DNA-binding MarR family transcriptional regulator/GNAT superfamily N-acetyltransferase